MREMNDYDICISALKGNFDWIMERTNNSEKIYKKLTYITLFAFKLGMYVAAYPDYKEKFKKELRRKK